ncbi:3-hydroxyacyl-CoA dehydrogenase NAD-binding domain-containing protein [Janthinobacterium sp. HLX7-2]|uniref:3-hydroxyacyl-CoA dehydrogenase n=1 Tax=Janthinobacterium sp. HLX7-2 TaxID=1259331 RepID=UPI003F227059
MPAPSTILNAPDGEVPVITIDAPPEAAALQHQASSEHAAMQLAPAQQAVPRPIRTVAIIGAGTMGTGIAISVLDADMQVLLLEQDPAALARGSERIDMHYRKRVSAGKLKAELAAANAARLQPCTDWTQLGQADLVIEAVFEELAVKLAVFVQIDAHARPGAVLASNTSYLDLDQIAAATSRPQDVLGLHFFSPANIMKLLEVVPGADTAPEVLATGLDMAKRLGKQAVVASNSFGFIGNRIYNAYRKQCEFMLEDGAWPEQVDAALQAFGFAMGPFAVADLSGLDIAWRMRRAQAAKRPAQERYVAILDHLCERGRLGQKAGAGYYNYADGKRSAHSDATVRHIIEQASLARGVARRHLSDTEICRRALLAMANEAAQLVAEGVASRASDIDVAMVHGYGFPRRHGGPVFWARRQALATLQAGMQELAAGSGGATGNAAALHD